MEKLVKINAQNQLEGGPLKVGIIGGTGTVGQKILANCYHNPWFEVTVIGASEKSAGKKYKEAVSKWHLDMLIPDAIGEIIVCNVQDIKTIADNCDIVFSATKLEKHEVKELEESYAQAGLWVSSCSSAQRDNLLVPTITPGVNNEHFDLIPIQREKLGYTTGANIVKSNCAVVPALTGLAPLIKDDISKLQHANFTIIQALSGIPSTREQMPQIIDNLIPLDGERVKTEQEPRKILGKVTEKGIALLNNDELFITAQNVRADIVNGHTAIVTITFKDEVDLDEVLKKWREAGKDLQDLPSAPANMIEYIEPIDAEGRARPQIKLDFPAGNGLTVTIGQVRAKKNVLQFIATSDNTEIGAGGGSVLATELAIKKGLVYRRI